MKRIGRRIGAASPRSWVDRYPLDGRQFAGMGGGGAVVKGSEMSHGGDAGENREKNQETGGGGEGGNENEQNSAGIVRIRYFRNGMKAADENGVSR